MTQIRYWLWLALLVAFIHCYAGQVQVVKRNLTCISQSCHSYSDQKPESFICSTPTTCVLPMTEATTTKASYCMVVQSNEKAAKQSIKFARRYSCFVPGDVVHHALTCGSLNNSVDKLNQFQTIKHYCCRHDLCNNITNLDFLSIDEKPEPTSVSTPVTSDHTIAFICAGVFAFVVAGCIIAGLAMRYCVHCVDCSWTSLFIKTRRLFSKPQSVNIALTSRDDGTGVGPSARLHNHALGCFGVPAQNDPERQNPNVNVPCGMHLTGAPFSVSNSHIQTPQTQSTQLAPSPNHSGINGWMANQQRTTGGYAEADEGVCAMSSSGSGLPILEKRTVSREIECYKLIGTGRYGSVYVGRWRDELVAVKKFHSFEYEAFKHEADLYLTCMLFHTNILRFIAVDSKDCVHCTEHWLITEYHQKGSLCTFLTGECVSIQQMLRLALSAATGLAHLHQTFNGQAAAGAGANASKPRIAHRDLKSHNILVKNDVTCAIGDLGAAMTYDQHCAVFRSRNLQSQSSAAIASRFRVGTRRYLAPEVLDDSINYANFESLLSADVYSFALVCWELLRRTRPRADAVRMNDSGDAKLCDPPETTPLVASVANTDALSSGVVSATELAPSLSDDGTEFQCPEYALPYFETADRDPCEDRMRQIVCDKQCRPQLDPRALRDPVIASMYDTLCESWCSSPDARLSAPRIKKRFRELADQLGVVAN